eukprot:4629163-Prymnesium_polylepis.1
MDPEGWFSGVVGCTLDVVHTAYKRSASLPPAPCISPASKSKSSTVQVTSKVDEAPRLLGCSCVERAVSSTLESNFATELRALRLSFSTDIADVSTAAAERGEWVCASNEACAGGAPNMRKGTSFDICGEKRKGTLPRALELPAIHGKSAPRSFQFERGRTSGFQFEARNIRGPRPGLGTLESPSAKFRKASGFFMVFKNTRLR